MGLTQGTGGRLLFADLYRKLFQSTCLQTEACVKIGGKCKKGNETTNENKEENVCEAGCDCIIGD